MRTRIPTTGILVAAGAVLAIAPRPAHAQSVPDYGLDFVTIGHAGNRGTLPSERPFAYDPEVPYGGVNYEYRLLRTELRVSDWLEFVNAYTPFNTRYDPTWPGLTSYFIYRDQQGSYQIEPGAENYPAAPNFEMAARYCNWLHNGKALTYEAFESGAYDMNDFERQNPVRSPGAKFWIPNQHEWLKAAYYDPNRYGQGQEGYWLFPNASNTPLVSGLPGVGQTNAGTYDPSQYYGPWFSVGSYPATQSYFGLLDLSGGEREWLETPRYAILNGNRINYRLLQGTWFNSSGDTLNFTDRIDWEIFESSIYYFGGIRLATVVPSPSGFVLWTIIGSVSAIRRRR